jgi:Rrf2 family iron-sulfur cluster assembly transcriptional regulator
VDIIRRNTDYALRAMVHLAHGYGSGPESTKTIATEENISYQLCCKLMQRLNKAGLVQSCMGVNGGFELSCRPAQISVLKIVETIQGPLSMNRCVLGKNVCEKQKGCPVRVKLGELQGNMTDYLSNTSLQDLIDLGH